MPRMFIKNVETRVDCSKSFVLGFSTESGNIGDSLYVESEVGGDVFVVEIWLGCC